MNEVSKRPPVLVCLCEKSFLDCSRFHLNVSQWGRVHQFNWFVGYQGRFSTAVVILLRIKCENHYL